MRRTSGVKIPWSPPTPCYHFCCCCTAAVSLLPTPHICPPSLPPPAAAAATVFPTTIKYSAAASTAAVAESTATTPAPCSTLPKVFDAMDRVITARQWLTTYQGRPWSGCGRDCFPCPKATATTIYMDAPTYVRLLEFGNEQAKLCKKSGDMASNPDAAIDSFIAQLKLLCADKAKPCSIPEYIAARVNLAKIAGCPAI